MRRHFKNLPCVYGFITSANIIYRGFNLLNKRCFCFKYIKQSKKQQEEVGLNTQFNFSFFADCAEFGRFKTLQISLHFCAVIAVWKKRLK